MSIVSLSRETVTKEAEKSEEEIFVEMMAEKTRIFEEDPVKFAQEQGRDMVAHFVEFVEGKKDSFRAYFVTTEEHHVNQHNGFWDEIRSNYPEMERRTFPDKPTERERHHIFADLGVMLRETAHIHAETGEEYDAMYVAERLPLPAENLGRIATAHIMQ